MDENPAVPTEMVGRLAARLSPEGRELLERMNRQEDLPDFDERFTALSADDRSILGQIIQLNIQYHATQEEAHGREADKFARVRGVVRRAIALSGVEDMKVGDAFEWLRKEGRLTEEEWRFYESIKDEVVRVPDGR